MNSPHSVELQIGIPNSSSKPCMYVLYMAIHATTVNSKVLPNALSLDRQYDTIAPFSRKFFSFSLDAGISEDLFDSPKFRSKSLILR